MYTYDLKVIQVMCDPGFLFAHPLYGPFLLAERTAIVLLHPQRHAAEMEAVVTLAPHHHAVLLPVGVLFALPLATEACVCEQQAFFEL